jgi:nicotinamide-nucleotide amidase
MFESEVRPRLAGRSGGQSLRRRVIKVAGRAESQVDEVAQPVYLPMLQWPVPVRTTILASPGEIELHLSARGPEGPAVDRVLDTAARHLADALGAAVVSTDGRTLAEVVGGLLRDRGEHIAVAESCTGGMVLGRLTDVPGSSAWVVGGVVAYADAVKINELGVPRSVIEAHGAVSEPVAVGMASGVRTRLHAAVGVGVTGIAGPGGGTPAKPVGTVAIAVDGPERLSKTFTFLGDRMHVRLQATQAALDMVRRILSPS